MKLNRSLRKGVIPIFLFNFPEEAKKLFSLALPLPEAMEKIQCPKFEQDYTLLPQGISGILEISAVEDSDLPCTSCKTKDSHAVVYCYNCMDYLCEDCIAAHQYSFKGREVVNLKEQAKDDFKTDTLTLCPRHTTETLRFYCRTCDIPICTDCTNVDHPKEFHDYDHISEVGPRQVEILRELHEKGKTKISHLKKASKSMEQFSSLLQMQYHKAQSEISETFNFYCSILEIRKGELIKELEYMYNTKMVSLSSFKNEVQAMIKQFKQIILLLDHHMKYSNYSEILIIKQILDSKLQLMLSYNPEVNMQSTNLEFLSSYQAIQSGIKNNFGYIRHNSEGFPTVRPQLIAGPNGLVNSDSNGHVCEPHIISQSFISGNSLSPFRASISTTSDISPYEKLSSSPIDTFQNGIDSFNTEPVTDSISKFISTYPIKTQIKRLEMVYHCTFGEFGAREGQFTEPNGVAVNVQNDIIVADTNNHRIQIFDKEGRYKFQFGECGKRDGQLLYPNRVFVVKTTGDIIVAERSPTRQIQIYNQYGLFIRKFGANILKHPRDVTVDSKGRIIVVECKVMRVVIFDQIGNVLQKFGCSKHLQFPNGVVVNDKEEIFISDNRSHCVQVLNYEGKFLRKIGGEGLTNYPIGICLGQKGEIVVADNYNTFSVTIFTQDGQLVNAFESKSRHTHCLDVALMDDGSLVLASKDNHLYIYHQMYIIPGLIMCC